MSQAGRRRVGLSALIFALIAACGPAPAQVAVKQIGAPPGDIDSGVVVLPGPDAGAARSRTALLPLRVGADGRAAPVSFFAHADRPVTVVVIAPGRWAATVDGPGADAWSLDSRTRAGADAVSGPLPATFGVRHGVRAARAELGRVAPGPRTVAADAPAGFVLVDPGAAVILETAPTTHRRVVGGVYGLRPRMDGARIEHAFAEVSAPNGGTEKVERAEDGVIRFTPRETGAHAVRVEAHGRRPDGTPVVLTTQHLIFAAEAAPLGAVRSQRVDGGVLTVSFDDAPGRTITAAEVWGSRAGEMVPVCWVARVCDGPRSLAVDLRWVSMAGVDPASLELRRVRSHDTDSYSLVGDAERLALGPVDAGLLPGAPAAVTREMAAGRPGAAVVEGPTVGDGPSGGRSVGPGHRLLLVHGYCSGGNPFPTADFSGDLAVYADPDANRSHDAFAQTILAQGAPMKSYGIVGHSQGGNAALHLSTFYWSGLDWAQGERRIQGVGVPFQGTPLAGDAAVLGAIFGTGCGPNADLAPPGALAWLSLIPTSERAGVWFWTTSFEDRPFAFDFCNIISDLLLSDPEDGVVERSRGRLSGGNNMGHTEGWCHTTGMRDPAQTTDSARNAEMNQRSAR